MLRTKITSIAQALRSNESGNVAMIAGLAILPIVSIAGLAIDLQMTTTKKNKVQHVVDSAVLAGSRQMQAGRSESEITQDVNAYVNALLETSGAGMTCGSVSLVFEEGGEALNASIFCSQDTTLSQVIGKEKMDFYVTSVSKYGIGKVEVAFVFDVSGSMGSNGRMTALKAAAQEAVDTLLPEGQETEDVRLAMMSYNNAVNVGEEYFTAVTGIPLIYNRGDFYYVRTALAKTMACTRRDRYGRCYRYGWTGAYHPETKQVWNNTCVIERRGAEAFTVEEPGLGEFIEAGAQWNEYRQRWDEISCNDELILPLTESRADLSAYIRGLDDGGGTAGHMGAAWGRYLVAPEWNDIWPTDSEALPYDEPDAAKAMILMTDGEFNSYYNSGENVGDADDQAIAHCTAAKQQGVVIYAVAFQAPTEGQAVLSACASSSSHYFSANNGQQLTDAYSQIAQSISDLRITH